jgi:general secretion pathway protein D
VIGGLIEESLKETVKRVPVLGRLPLAGALFRRTQTTKVKTELLIFLTPHVAYETDLLQEISDSESSRAQKVEGAVRPGAFQEQMDSMSAGKKEPVE